MAPPAGGGSTEGRPALAMSEPSPHLRCPMCLQVTPTAVTLPCGHSFCLPCLRTMDQGLDRHCCPQCRQDGFLNKSSLSADSELYDYLKSKIVESNGNLAANVEEKMTRKEDLGGGSGFQNKTPLLRSETQIAGLAPELEKAERLLEKEQQHELTVTAANAKLREDASKLVENITSSARDFSEQVMKLIEREFSPGEAVVRDRVGEASARTEQMIKAMQDAENLLREEDSRVFTSKITSVELEIEKCNAVKQPGGGGRQEVKCDLAKLCPELERLSAEFRDKLGQVQRSLRNVFNPSEVTFDPETLHPNLVLSEDMKTVRFSAKKQQCTPSPKRFSTFFQVLSTQSFGAGVHRWEVQLEGAPWMLGVCAASALPRAGLPSALETCPTSWVLMWSNNALTAFERCRAVPLKKTSEVSRRLRVELDWDTRALTFHHLGLSGSCLIHRFTLDTEEPLHLAYRMLSGDPKGRATILCS
uniref:Tripartite motif containing 107 n=1 Tax=Neogobius melanostomus TaxID=47308 RepID=A0A8C6WJC8_9GOBI